MAWIPVLIPVLLGLAAAVGVYWYRTRNLVALERLVVVLSILVGAAVVLCARVFLAEWTAYVGAVAYILGALFCFSALFVLHRRVARSGAVVFEIGRRRGALLCAILAAAALLVFDFVTLLMLLDFRGHHEDTAGQVVRISLAICFNAAVFGSICVAMRKDSVREGGILAQGRFFPWEKIEHIEWKAGTPCTLLVVLRTRLPLFRNCHLRVPTDKKAGADEALRRLAPGKMLGTA